MVTEGKDNSWLFYADLKLFQWGSHVGDSILEDTVTAEPSTIPLLKSVLAVALEEVKKKMFNFFHFSSVEHGF